jgi:hypothetical protein
MFVAIVSTWAWLIVWKFASSAPSTTLESEEVIEVPLAYALTSGSAS